MSLSSQHSLTCQSCGWEQEFTAWDSLNVTLDPEAKEQLLRGELTRLVCAQCGRSGDVLYPMLYHDMGQKLMIYLLPSGGEPEPIDEPLFAPMQNYRFRRVSTRNELREKILIFDAGLDDRLLECAKETIRVEMARGGRPLIGELLFAGTADSADGQPVIGLVQLTAQGQRTLELPVADLAQFSRLFTGSAPPSASGGLQWPKVDGEFAQAALSSAHQDSPPASGGA